MFPPTFYKHFGTRIKLTKFALGTYYQWDPETEQLVLAPPYLIYGMYAALSSGCSLVVLHGLNIYLKTHSNDIPEETQLNEYQKNKSGLSFREIASLIIQVGEMLLIACCSMLNYLLLKRVKIFMKLFNQLLSYNKMLSELIEKGELLLSEKQKVIIKLANILNYVVIGISTFLPFGVLAAFSQKIEPHHQMFEEWFEIPLELKWNILPLIIIIACATYGVGTTAGLMCMLVNVYFTTTVICTEAFTPKQMIPTPKDGPGRSKVKTSGFGMKSDLEVIQLYRTQQMFNVLLSSFFRSLLMSFHHVGLLACVVALLVFVVKYQELLIEKGPLAYTLVFSIMMAPLMIIYFQSNMGGAVVDISEGFKMAGRKMFQRRTLFHKFARSCTTFYIEVTYPFYTIHKETFTMFGEHVIGFSMDILLSLKSGGNYYNA